MSTESPSKCWRSTPGRTNGCSRKAHKICFTEYFGDEAASDATWLRAAWPDEEDAVGGSATAVGWGNAEPWPDERDARGGSTTAVDSWTVEPWLDKQDALGGSATAVGC